MKKHLIKLTILLLFASSITSVNAQWVAQTSGTTNDLYNASFIDSNTGWVVGANGTVLKTVNSGLTWTQLTTNTTDDLYAVSFVSSTTGYVCGESFRNMKTTNGGTSWTSIPWSHVQYVIESNIKSIHAFSSATVVGVGDPIVFRTTNSFSNINTWGSFGIQNCLFYVNSTTGWMVGNSGKIYKLTGTITFTNQTSGTTEDLLGVHFVSTSVGYVVGKNGTILKTTDGGTNWGSLASGVSVDLHSVFFTDANTGYVVGENETILKTTDGGSNWTIQMSGTNTNQTHSFVWFTDANNGWIVGSNGAIYHTSNGGEASVGMAATPFGPNSRCQTPATYSTSAVNATSYLWTLEPVASGSITGSGSTATVTWNSSYTGNTTITAQGQNASEFGSVSNPLIVYGNPSAFSLTSPTNGSWVSETPMFQWASSSGTLSYQIFIDGVLFKDNITTTSYQVLPEDALQSGMHTWYVVASNGCTTQSNETRSFMVDATPPTSFNLLTPADNSWTTSLQPTLEWSASSDSHSGLAKYQLWINGALNRDNISPSSTSTTPIAELSNDEHTWEIKAIDNVGNVRSSTETWSLNIDNIPPQGLDIINYALALDGVNDYCEIPHHTSLDFSGQITIEAWIKISSYTNWAAIISKGGFNWTEYGYAFTQDNTGRIRFYGHGGAGSNSVTSNSIIPLNTWTHVAVTYGNNNIKFYINGTLDKSTNTTINITNNTTSLKIGVDPPEIVEYWHGNIDEVRIWNIIRTQDEIIENKNKLLSGCNTHLVGYWTFNEFYDNTIIDASINANDAIVLNGGNLIDDMNLLGCLTNLIFPLNNQYFQTAIPFFNWEKAFDSGVGLEKYQLWIDCELKKDNINDTLCTIIDTLIYGLHTWHITGYDSLGNFKNSAMRIFYIDNAPPNPFNLISPANNEAVMFPTPNLSWEAATDSTGGSGMRKYQLWINGVINRDSIPIGTTTTSPSSALPQGEYTWFVRAYDNVGNFRQSTETRTFYVDWEAPTDFALISPSDGATVTTAQPTFEWEQSFDYGSGLSKYELCISGYSPIVISPTETEHSLTFELPNSTYSWFVKAYDNANAFTSSNTHTLNVAVPLPEQAATPVGLTEICSVSGSTNYETTGAINASTYNWEVNPSEAGILTPNGLSCSINWNQYFTGEVEITVTGENSVGNGPVSEALLLNLYAPTDTATANGGSFICLGLSTGDLYLTGYNGSVLNWQKSNDLLIWDNIESTGTIYNETPTATGQYFYRAITQNGACPSVASNYTQVNVADVPGDIGIISGLDEVCQGQNEVSYTVPGIDTINTYIWTLPSGYSGISTTNEISISFTDIASSGNVLVAGENSCGVGQTSELFITVLPLPHPAGSIEGNTSVCQSETGVIYTVPEISNATSYVWTLPSGATGTSTSNSITVDFGSAAISGDISVYGTNNCGDGQISTLAITVNPLPEEAGLISGTENVCFEATGVTYTVPEISNATSYVWSLPSGVTGTSTNNSITVDFESSAISGDISVYGTNDCGDGQISTFAITVNPLPDAAGTITGNTTVCQGETGLMYTVPEIAHATSYVWSLPSGVTGTSTSNSITVDFESSAISSDISVYGTNDCGDGQNSTLAITVNPLPDEPENITGSTAVCQGSTLQTYTVPEIANATSYVWTLPNGATGTSTSNSIDVDFGTTAISGNISVHGTNDCGDGQNSTLSITVNPLPDAAETITGNTTVCQGETGIMYTIPEIANATSYVWSLPSGVTGTSTNNSITVDFESSAISGDISVYGTNDCGDGQSSTLGVIVNEIPETPTISLSGNTLNSDATVGNQWYLNDEIIIGAINQDYDATSDGNYFVIVTLLGCSSTPSNIINVIGTDIYIINNESSVSIYPNPVKDELIIEITNNTNLFDYEIINSMGQVVKKGLISTKAIVNTESFAPGVYLIKLENGEKFEFRKIVKE